MSYHTVGLMSAAATVALTLTLDAQKNTPMKTGSGGSPHLRSEWTIDGARISIEYGRPLLKGRSPAEMMPAGQVWRTGADEQTTLETDKPLKFGALAIPAGTYGIHTIPGANEWQLIVSKRSSGWGVPYPQGQDLGRVPMKLARPAAPVEQLTISVDDSSAGAVLRIEWGTASASVPFTVG